MMQESIQRSPCVRQVTSVLCEHQTQATRVSDAPSWEISMFTAECMYNRIRHSSVSCTSSLTCPAPPIMTNHLPKTLTTPSPPALTTNRPSADQTTAHTPSPLQTRWQTRSCVQMRFSSDQKRIDASWPAVTASLPSEEILSAEMAEGCASIVYVHWPGWKR